MPQNHPCITMTEVICAHPNPKHVPSFGETDTAECRLCGAIWYTKKGAPVVVLGYLKEKQP